MTILAWILGAWVGIGLAIYGIIYWWLTTWSERNALTPPSEPSPYWFPRCKWLHPKNRG